MNYKNNKRTRDSSSPTKNHQNEKIKQHNNKIPVLGSKETWFPDPLRGTTNVCGQQLKKNPRTLSRS